MTRFVALLLATLAATVQSFAPVPLPALASARTRAAVPSLPVAAVPRPQQLAVVSRGRAVQMGLFGLGWAEIGVIGLIALFFFGPEKLAPLAKDLGKRARTHTAILAHCDFSVAC